MPEAHSIFVLPPSYAELRRRLEGRGADEAGARARRLALSLSEIECYRDYEYVIVNSDLQLAAGTLAAIIVEKRHRRARMQEVAEAIADDFRTALGGAR
jgi:guanylate kinase